MDRIVFAGARPHNKIPMWMNASDVFCLPSRNEGCPNVVLEALACGRPIVASKVGGIPEIVKSEEHGILVSPENATELRNGILRALEKDWANEALRQSVINFDWEENAKKVFAVLNSAKYFSSEVEKNILPRSNNKIKRIIKHYITSIIPKQWIIWRGNRNHGLNRVALTFDDGPNPEYTVKVLDILGKYSIKATFFLLGSEVEKYPEIAKRIVNEGHGIGNHGFSHRKINDLTNKDIVEEIVKTEKVFESVFNRGSNFFRPPYGRLCFGLLWIMQKLKMQIVFWSKDSMDWKKGSKESLIDTLNINNIKSGDIVLLHDDNDFTLEALPVVIEALKNRGYCFSTIDELTA